MIKNILPSAILFLVFHSYSQVPVKVQMNQMIDINADDFGAMAKQIWSWAELGYLESKSSTLIQERLKKEGFKIESGVAGLPTAFVASYGSGNPVIGLLAEFDALPGMSQTVSATEEKFEGSEHGHGCGHNLLGIGSTAAAIAIKQQIEAGTIKGTIKLFGTPAEEGGAGKVYMVRSGLFEDVDAVLHWHPSSINDAGGRATIANISAKFRFHGQSAHASSPPHRGRSALDGVEAMNMMVNMLREHIHSSSRIHYSITHGGDAPNVVPSFAEVYYFIRHPKLDEVKALLTRVIKTAEAAAHGTETTMEYEIIHGVYNLLPNKTLAELMYKNLQQIGGVHYDDEEQEFARSIASTYDFQDLDQSQVVWPFEFSTNGGGGSTDVGDISWNVPTAGLLTACRIPGSPAHSWQAVAAAGSSIGIKGMLNAAKVLSNTAYDLFSNPQLIEQSLQELKERRGDDFDYEPLFGDREPPLDYRLDE